MKPWGTKPLALISKRVIGWRWWLARVAKYLPLPLCRTFEQTLENRSDARLNQLYCSCCCCRHGLGELGGETHIQRAWNYRWIMELERMGCRWKNGLDWKGLFPSSSNQKTVTTSNKDVTGTISLIAKIPVIIIVAPPQCPTTCVNSVLAGGQCVSQHWWVSQKL